MWNYFLIINANKIALSTIRTVFCLFYHTYRSWQLIRSRKWWWQVEGLGKVIFWTYLETWIVKFRLIHSGRMCVHTYSEFRVFLRWRWRCDLATASTGHGDIVESFWAQQIDFFITGNYQIIREFHFDWYWHVCLYVREREWEKIIFSEELNT